MTEGVKDLCARCGVKWPRQSKLQRFDNFEEVQDLMTKLMNGYILTTVDLETLQGFVDEPETPNILEYCLLCKHQFTQTLNWSRFPNEVIN
jgi:hypothetical protein